MGQSNGSQRPVARFAARVGAVAVTGLFVFLFTCAAASASPFEQTGIFAGSLTPPPNPGEFSEEVQLGGVGGMAVNSTGAGGVKAGTVYAVTALFGTQVRVAMFIPSGEGLKFSQAWEVTRVEKEYERCGPDAPGSPVCATRSGAGAASVGVAVDQATGNVYVFSTDDMIIGDKAVREYNADGSKVVARFGEVVAGSKPTAEEPGKIHKLPRRPGGIAVNDSGEVYVYDVDSASYHRLMVFKPESPGDYAHYVYAGKESDVGTGLLGEGVAPERPVVDAAGNLYVTDEGAIQEYEPASPVNPICDFKLKVGGIIAMTVNPETGEPFYYTYKDKNLHQLSACKEGKFTQTSEFSRTLAPKRGDIYALAFDPQRKIGKRPPGALYGGVPDPQAELSSGAIGYIFAPAEENPPVIEAESVAKVTSDSTELRTLINPKGFETRYALQYLTDAAYKTAGESFEEAIETPLGGAVLGSGQSGLSAAALVLGLSPDTEYHYRVIATSHCAPSEKEKVCETIGAAQAFRTFSVGASVRPDKRAYELVSPAQKNGGQVLPADPTIRSCGLVECKPGGSLERFPMQSAPDGEAVVFEGTSFFGAEGAVLGNEYWARRSESGWQTSNLTPPSLLSKSKQGFKAFDAGLEKGVLEQTSPSLTPEAPSNYSNLYRQPTNDPLSLDPLLVEAPPHREPGSGAGHLELNYAGSSDDLSRIFFSANDELNGEGGGGAEEETNLYEWAAGQLHLVSVGPSAEVLPGAVYGSGTLLNGGGGFVAADVVSHAISSDGSRAFFSSGTGQPYVRLNGATVEIPDHSGKFLTASADGSHVLLSDGHLFTDLESEPPTEEADLTQGKGGFEGIAGQSEDLSHVYFVDTAVLTGEEVNSEGAKAQASQNNLYSWSEGSTTFVATLLAADNPKAGGDWGFSPVQRTAEASPDGGWVAFLSEAPLTGYDNTGPCQLLVEEKVGDGPCTEVFLYSSAAAHLSCPSCNPSAARPLGPSVLRVNKESLGPMPQPRYLTSAGRLFFDSRDSLVPADSNGGVEDVYEFEPSGVGSCNRSGGCVGLVSAGGGSEDSNFLAMDESGENVFFTTRDRLVPADTDALIDLYDARVEGGFAQELPPNECQGEGCKPPPIPQPEPTVPSEGVNGPGNPKPPPPRCKKGQVKRNGRCVKKPHHRKHRARRASHNRGGAK